MALQSVLGAVTLYCELPPGDDRRLPQLQLVVGAVRAGELSLQQLVQQLGGVLTSQDDVKRAGGTGLLAEVLGTVPGSTSTESCSHLVAFLCDRLKDVGCLEEVLCGLLALLRGHVVGDTGAALITQAILAELAVQALPQRVRKLVYQIFVELIARYLVGLQPLATDFVAGVIAAMDGEKDPRNLMVTFKLVRSMVTALEPAQGEMAEELFDVISCYYPITFEAPPGDKFGVTGDNLRLELAAAFCATPAFAPFCLALLADKLSSSVGSTKVQCLKDLGRCAEAYGPEPLNDHFERVWGLVIEESGNIDSRVAVAAVQTVSALLRVFARAVHNTPESIVEQGKRWHPHAKAAVDALVGRTTYTIQTQACSAHQITCLCRLTAAAAGISAELFSDFAIKMLPPLLKNCDPTRPQQQLAVVSLLAELADAAATMSASKPFAAHKDIIMQTLATAVDCTAVEETPIKAIKCMGALVSVSDDEGTLTMTDEVKLLSSQEIISIISRSAHTVLDHVMRGEGAAPLSSGCVDSMVSISVGHSQTVEQYGLVALYSKLQELLSAPGASTAPAVDGLLKSLVALAKATSSHFVFTVPRLVSELHSILSQCAANHADEGIVDLACKLFVSLEETFGDAVVQDVSHCATQCAGNTYSCVAEYVAQVSVGGSVSEELVASAEVTLRRLVRVMESEGQTTVADAAIAHLLGGASSEPSIAASMASRTPLLRVTGAVITALSSTVSLDRCSELLVVLGGVASWNPPATTMDARIAGQCLGSLFNKDDGALADAKRSVVESLSQACQDASCGEDKLLMCGESLVWVTKGLVQRDDPQSATLIRLLCNLLDSGSTRMRSLIADGLGTIISKQGDVLTRQCHATVRMLYPQKMFCVSFPLLVALAKAGNEACECALLAIANVCPHVPSSVLEPEVDQILAMMVRSLTTNHIGLVQRAIENMLEFCSQDQEALIAQLSEIVPALIEKTTFRGSSAVRQAACRCLESFAELPAERVIPYRTSITRGLKPALDDPKRRVRKVAADAANAFHFLTV